MQVELLQCFKNKPGASEQSLAQALDFCQPLRRPVEKRQCICMTGLVVTDALLAPGASGHWLFSFLF